MSEYGGQEVLENFGQIVQLAFDGIYLWLGDGGSTAKLTKFNPTTGHSVSHLLLNPDSDGAGGVQGVVYDPVYNKIWAGVAQAESETPGAGLVLKIDPVTEAIELTVTAQTNVNGLALAMYEGQRYVLAANHDAWTKINADTGTYDSYGLARAAHAGYRIATDNTYVYVSYYYGNYIAKYNLSDGEEVEFDPWVSTTGLNTVLWDGFYIWTAGDSTDVVIHEPVGGSIICTLYGLGQSDLVFDGAYVWSIVLNSGSGATVNRVTGLTPTFTITPTYTNTATPTPDTIAQLQTAIAVLETQIAIIYGYIFTATVTPTITETSTVTATATETGTEAPTATDTPDYSPTITVSPTITATITETHTVSPTLTVTKTRTETRTPTPGYSATITPTRTTGKSIWATNVPTATKTPLRF